MRAPGRAPRHSRRHTEPALTRCSEVSSTMQRPTVQRFTLLAIVLLATVLRVYQLKDLPAGLFLALCPWHVHFSRIAFELISFPFLFVIGLTLLVRYTQGQRRLARAMFFLALCVYAYQVANLFLLLFMSGFSLLYLPDLLR